MRIDTRVSKIKFEEEVRRLDTQSETLKIRGIVVHNIDFPVAYVVFIPRNYLKLQFPVQIPPGVIIPPGPAMPMVAIDIPSLAARAFGVKISLDDFDQRAPSVVFCDPFTWQELTYNQLHRGNHIGDNKTAFNVILDRHPITKKPFLCMRGIREYHEHPQHTGDDWMQYRKHVGLFSTIDTIWKTCVLNANPVMIFQPPNITVTWLPTGAN